jgi:hypothetical protein
MTVTCQHGLDVRFCLTCQQAGETVPLRRDALRVTEEGKPALLLRTHLGSLEVTTLVSDGKTIRFETMKEISLRHPLTVIPFNQRKVLKLFLDLTLQKGCLFQPDQELTYREPMEEGPPQCCFDHFDLSLEKGSLGCTQCGKYVCQCGRCLCGYAGQYRRGQVLNVPPLPVSREERLEYIRVVRFCVDNIERRPKAKVFQLADFKRKSLKRR